MNQQQSILCDKVFNVNREGETIGYCEKNIKSENPIGLMDGVKDKGEQQY
jgi:hypothetical protein